MKTFTKRLTLVTGMLFTALICMGIVYIDTVQNYWYVNGGFVKLIVSNRTDQAIMTVDTNLLRVGFNTNNVTFAWAVMGRSPSNVTTSVGGNAGSVGGTLMRGGAGGNTTIPTSGTGGAGGNLAFFGGDGGQALPATTNSTTGAGGAINFTSGSAGSTTGGVATNKTTGGAGGAINFTTAAGAVPDVASTNTQAGAGGQMQIVTGAGGTPSAGFTRQGGAGGPILVTAGAGGSGTRTNGGDGGSITYTAGAAGAVGTAPGEPGNGGTINLNAGSGGSGGTNSNGGSVYAIGGSSSAATPGNVVLARNVTGTARGGVQIGPFISGGSATITNVLGGVAELDFPSTAAGAFSELTISVTGVTSNNVAVALSVPWESAQTGGAFVTFNSNDVIYVRFINNQLVSAIDPTPGTFSVVGFRIR